MSVNLGTKIKNGALYTNTQCSTNVWESAILTPFCIKEELGPQAWCICNEK